MQDFFRALLSIPMLFYMVAAANLPGFLSGSNDLVYWLIFFVVVGLVEANALAGNATTKKPLTSVSGTIHFGLGVWVLLYIVGALLNS